MKPDTQNSMNAASYSGRVEFVKEIWGICISVRGLHDALFSVTIEDRREKIEVQTWLSAFGRQQDRIEEFVKGWSAQLQEMSA
jgi:hypothetical protein